MTLLSYCLYIFIRPQHFNMTFGEATEHLNRRNEALRWSILVRKLKHKVQKPIISSEYSYNCGQQTSPTASVTEQSS